MTPTDRLYGSVAAALQHALAGRAAIVLCPKSGDVPHWHRLLDTAGNQARLVIALDNDRLTALTRSHPVTGAGSYLALQHHLIADLTTAHSTDPALQDFDPSGRAVLLIPDPLDPPHAGKRARLGRKISGVALIEDKTLVDPIWDRMGVPRENSIVCDLTSTFSAVAATVDAGAGVVASCQQRGAGPQAGGEGIWWWRGHRPPPAFPVPGPVHYRIRVMPLLEGMPCRIHGMIIGGVLVFPPLELVSLPRSASGTFLWAGAVPLTTAPPAAISDLAALAGRVGRWLARHLGHRGAFAVDGILTAQGYRPTEITTRLTSAFESAAPPVRVLLHAANLLARSGHQLAHSDDLIGVARDALTVDGVVHLYGASAHAVAGAAEQGLSWTQYGPVLNPDPGEHGRLTLTRSPRGWLVHARLAVAGLPRDAPIGAFAPSLFALADAAFGTEFGELAPPFGIAHHPAAMVPNARIPPGHRPAARSNGQSDGR